MSLVLLPTELLVEVMQRLDSATELANFTRSAQFARAAASQHDVVIWRALTLKRWPAAESSVVAAMGLGWKARYRHYRMRAERNRLQAVRPPSLTAAQMNEQFSFYIECQSDSRRGLSDVPTNVGETASTLRAVVLEDQLNVFSGWCFTTVEEVAPGAIVSTLGPQLEIFAVRHADNAVASFAELNVSNVDFHVYAEWYASNNDNWAPGSQAPRSLLWHRRRAHPSTPLPPGGHGGETIMAFSRSHPDGSGSLEPTSLSAPFEINIECHSTSAHGGNGFYQFDLSDLSNVLTRATGGVHWKVLE